MEPAFLNHLNEVQKVAVLQSEGPVMVLAGAGSGKTRVLTYRVAFLLSQGVEPYNIMALTFTNKAAREMKDRIISLVGDQKSRSVWMGTFHSVFAKILRFECEKIGYPNNFTIYDTDDSKSVLKAIVKEYQFDDKAYSPGFLLNRISSAKMNLIDPDMYLQDPEIQYADKSANKPLVGQIYKEYWKRCRRSAAMDFDDILYNTDLLFRDFPEVLLKYQNRFHYILVDEYQDTNYAQYLIIRRLAALRQNICVVGDDAQSIYAFRGANIQNILNFSKDYPDHKIFKLEQNYRSTKNIVDAANSVIVNNKSRLHKEVWTENDVGEQISLFKSSNDAEEALMIANSIFHSRMTYQMNNSDFAILYRTNAQSRALEEAMRKLNIPYRVYGGISFYKRKEVKDMLGYFRLVVNPADNEAFFRVINYPTRGIGNTTINKLALLATQYEKPIWDIVENLDKIPNDFNSGIRRRLGDFYTLIKNFQLIEEKTPAYELAKKIAAASGMMKALFEDKTPEGVSRYENLEAVLNGVKMYEDDFATENEGAAARLVDFMLNVALLTDMDEKDDENDKDRVSLMTIHAAKGLEFPFVYIGGLEENLFPNSMSVNSRAELEEERRLFYVAITRAMKKLTLSFAEMRYKWGEMNFCEPSRFIDEIDGKFVDIPRKFVQKSVAANTFNPLDKKEKTGNVFAKKTVSNSPPPGTKDKNFLPGELAKISDIAEGVRVEHARFRHGTVVKVEGEGPNIKASVEFDGFGVKQLVLRFARLKLSIK